MRARKKNLISNERKEKLIHKETLRFLNILETYSSENNDHNSILVIKNNSSELYENIANHIRDCLEKEHVNNNELRDYLNHEEAQIKNIFLDNSNDEKYDTLSPPNTEKNNSELYTQTIFDITTRSHDDVKTNADNIPLDNNNDKNWTVNLEHHTSSSSSKENAQNTAFLPTDSSKSFQSLQDIKNTKFSNLKTKEIQTIKPIPTNELVKPNSSLHKKLKKTYKDKHFIRLSEQAFLKNIFDIKTPKLGLFRYLKFLIIKMKRDKR